MVIDLHAAAGAAGGLTTATGLTFTGDSANNALALRTSDGATLWHSGTGRVGKSPAANRPITRPALPASPALPFPGAQR